MKVNCSRCSTEVKVNRSQINQKLWKFFEKTGLYMCGWCRREHKVYRDADATIKELKEIQNGRH